MDGFFLDIMKYSSITAYPFENGLSYYNMPIVICNNQNISLHRMPLKKKVRLINDQTLHNFQSLLQEETWDTVYSMNNVHKMFNNFQCILARNFENSLPTIYIGNRPKDNNWIMKGTKLPCKIKIKLYILSSSSLVFSPKAGFGRNQSPVRRPVWLWHTAF